MGMEGVSGIRATRGLETPSFVWDSVRKSGTIVDAGKFSPAPLAPDFLPTDSESRVEAPPLQIPIPTFGGLYQRWHEVQQESGAGIVP